MRINWWDAQKEILVDAGRLPPGSPVCLRSQHHLTPPIGYEVLELIPKVFHKWRGATSRVVATLGVDEPPNASAVSVSWSEPWALGAPDDQRREAVFQGRLEGEPGSQADAAVLRASYLFVERQRRSSTRGAGVKVDVPTPTAVQIGADASIERANVTTFVARAPVDPDVEVGIVEGRDLGEHLQEQSRTFGEGRAGPGYAGFLEDMHVEGYFRSSLLSAQRTHATIEPGVPVIIEVGYPHLEGLQTGFALSLHDEDGSLLTVSEPVFLTDVGGYVVESDLPVGLLDAWSADAMPSLADAIDNLQTLGQRGSSEEFVDASQSPFTDVWRAGGVLADQLGTSTVQEAIMLVRRHFDDGRGHAAGHVR